MSAPKKKPICKVCPKKKPCQPVKDFEPLEEGVFELPVEEEEIVEEEETEDECLEEESCKQIATAGYVLDEIPPKKKERKSFFAPDELKARYENMLPLDVTNDHQHEASLRTTVIDHMSALRVTSEPLFKRQPAIIATIGPSCTEVSQIEDLLDAGMNIARINMAYGDRCCQLNAIRNFKQAVKNYCGRIGMKIPVGLMMDLKGPEIRTGRICKLYACDPENPQILIEKSSVVKLTTETTYSDKCTPTLLYIDFPLFPQYVRPGMKIYIDDGSIHLTVRKVSETEVITFVEAPGYLGNLRPVHIPMVPLDMPALTNIDAEDIEFGVEEEFDFIAVSKIENADVLHSLKSKLVECLLMAKKLRERPIMVLSKISNFQAVRNIDEILEVSDGVIIQRGDLGLDLPPEKVYVAQREIIGKCNLANKPVICCTQLMRSMTRRPLIDRSHIFDVASCIEDGADGVCLTGETAVGDLPAEVVEQTHNILREAEAANSRKYHFNEITEKLHPPIEPVMAIGMAACIVAEKIGATAIIVLTTSGRSAQIISWFRPRCVVLAVTKFERTARQMHLWKSVCPLIYTGPCVKNNWFTNLDLRFQYGITFGKMAGFIESGDPLVLVSGYGKTTAFTNCLRVVYASTEPGLYLEHSKEFYNNIYLQRNCSSDTKKGPCEKGDC
ncbi:hypothetical protein RUM44_011497 [Polyplax serrata]|uniref:Pyruvate kinase n=1 Tax=Polyplax serrata TaxID=468196 RepID=A0ABR1AQ75_POLSC